MDILFERKIPARQFKHTAVNAFDHTFQHKVELMKDTEGSQDAQQRA